MKAYCVFCCDPYDGSLLVFAETANKARVKACRNGPYEWSDEYLDTRARRAKEWDKYADAERIIETNDDLPAGAPAFYDNEML